MKTIILQFGEGNFLRCFLDWMVQLLDERTGFDGSVRIVQPRGKTLNAVSAALNAQGGRYHTCLRGVQDGRCMEEFQEIRCVEGVSLASDIESLAVLPDLRFVVSNTTEAGIEYRRGEDTFPAKVARLLRVRHAAGLPGLVFLPCELIEHNGDALKACVLRHVADDAADADALASWIGSDCVFCSTLVDRIVSGRPEPESAARYEQMLGGRDEALVCGEPFHFLVVETPGGFDLEAELPLARAGVNIVHTSDLTPYRTRKVRFLNGAHTATIPEGILAGFSEVAELVADPYFHAHFRTILFDEIFPTVDLPDADKRAYAESVLERFANPYAHHKLLSIALNSVSKWRVRVLPTVLDYRARFGVLPPRLWGSLDQLLRLYRERPDLVNDTPEVASFLCAGPSREAALARTDFWGMDLNTLEP